jgi:hypothetical protein
VETPHKRARPRSPGLFTPGSAIARRHMHSAGTHSLSRLQQTKTIFIATTFREFDGSANDAIQRLFLESLKSQTYANWQLVVTVFHEKTVQDTVRSIIPDAVIRAADAGEYRFSLTDVLLNALDAAHAEKKSVILWTTCDVIFENTFFEQIIRNYSEKFAGTSHPHRYYQTVEQFTQQQDNFIYNKGFGIDTVFFSTDVLASETVKNSIAKYRFINWGYFENFLAGIAVRYSDKKINVCALSWIAKIVNDREANQETQEYFHECTLMNRPVLQAFLKDEGLPEEFEHAHVCNGQFLPVK